MFITSFFVQQIIASLWVLSIVGSCCNFLTLFYISMAVGFIFRLSQYELFVDLLLTLVVMALENSFRLAAHCSCYI